MKKRSDVHRNDRGATFVEYALLLGAMVVVAIGAISALGLLSTDRIEAVGADIGSPPKPVAVSPTTSPSSPNPTSPGPGTPNPTAPNPTSPPPTTAAPSPTTTPPTTSAPAPSTTVAPAPPPTTTPTTTSPNPTTPPTTTPKVKSGWVDASATKKNKNFWRADATVNIYGTDGRRLSGNNAVEIRVTQVYRTWDGRVEERSWTIQAPLSGGSATFTSNDLATGANGQEAIVSMRYEVTQVLYYWPNPPAVAWDGSKPAVTIDAP